ncbi:SH3 and multiple ankyrin repeat domains protein 3 [Allomyces arbusculus]|nr:SH3 and multiple ankyrin repeat domains protein 3 [Allomyces arbusculus]
MRIKGLAGALGGHAESTPAVNKAGALAADDAASIATSSSGASRVAPVSLVLPGAAVALTVTVSLNGMAATASGDTKIFKYQSSDRLWKIKLEVLDRCPDVATKVKDAWNWGFMTEDPRAAAALNARAQGKRFLNDGMTLGEYGLTGDASVTLCPRFRVTGMSEKDYAKVNVKKSQKKFVDYFMTRNYDKLKERLDKGFDPNFATETNETPLSLAACADDKFLIKVLVEEGGAHVDYRTPDGKTALHLAAQSNKVVGVRSLVLTARAWVDAEETATRATSLHVAAAAGHIDIVEALLTLRANPNAVDSLGRTPLHAACSNNHASVVTWLLRYGADANAQMASSGNSPLHACATAGAVECARELLKRGAVRDGSNRAGQTAMNMAIMGGNYKLSDMIKEFKPEEVEPYPETTPDMFADFQPPMSSDDKFLMSHATSVPIDQINPGGMQAGLYAPPPAQSPSHHHYVSAPNLLASDAPVLSSPPPLPFDASTLPMTPIPPSLPAAPGIQGIKLAPPPPPLATAAATFDGTTAYMAPSPAAPSPTGGQTARLPPPPPPPPLPSSASPTPPPPPPPLPPHAAHGYATSTSPPRSMFSPTGTVGYRSPPGMGTFRGPAPPPPPTPAPAGYPVSTASLPTRSGHGTVTSAQDGYHGYGLPPPPPMPAIPGSPNGSAPPAWAHSPVSPGGTAPWHGMPPPPPPAMHSGGGDALGLMPPHARSHSVTSLGPASGGGPGGIPDLVRVLSTMTPDQRAVVKSLLEENQRLEGENQRLRRVLGGYGINPDLGR